MRNPTTRKNILDKREDEIEDNTNNLPANR